MCSPTLTPNLLAAGYLFSERSPSPACCFNYTSPCVLSEYIIQNEVHLKNIKITNAHHYSHNLTCTMPFLVLTLFHLCVLSIPSPMAVCPLPAWASHINCFKRLVLPPHEHQARMCSLRRKNSSCPSPIVCDEENTVSAATKWIRMCHGVIRHTNLSRPGLLFYNQV